MLPQEDSLIKYSETLFPVFLEPKNQFPRQVWSSQIPKILASKYRTWNGKRPDETSGVPPQTKTLGVIDEREKDCRKYVEMSQILRIEDQRSASQHSSQSSVLKIFRSTSLNLRSVLRAIDVSCVGIKSSEDRVREYSYNTGYLDL